MRTGVAAAAPTTYTAAMDMTDADTMPATQGGAGLPTRLQHQLVARIVCLIHEDALPVGSRLSENRLAERLAVSRSPVRAALNQLAKSGVVVFRPRRGMELAVIPPAVAESAPAVRPEDELLVRIARDRYTIGLNEALSENELIRHYKVPRQVVRSALLGMETLGMVQRKPGYGWRLLNHWDPAARAESYTMRRLIEPAAILQPAFALAPEWVATMRARHNAVLGAPWGKTSSITLFEVNSDFHEGLAAASGNRHFLATIRHLNQMRRLSNYYWRHGFDRVEANHAEHMGILDRIEASEMDIASALMRRHLDIAEAMPFNPG